MRLRVRNPPPLGRMTGRGYYLRIQLVFGQNLAGPLFQILPEEAFDLVERNHRQIVVQIHMAGAGNNM